MRVIETTGKTIEEAIDIALVELNASREEVEIKVINRGKSGLLGLVSENALKELGIDPSPKTFDSKIECAKIFSPKGKEITINSKKQKIIVINRRELDKQVARQARDNGAEISVKTSFNW